MTGQKKTITKKENQDNKILSSGGPEVIPKVQTAEGWKRTLLRESKKRKAS